jgi:hypothetical protein
MFERDASKEWTTPTRNTPASALTLMVPPSRVWRKSAKAEARVWVSSIQVCYTPRMLSPAQTTYGHSKNVGLGLLWYTQFTVQLTPHISECSVGSLIFEIENRRLCTCLHRKVSEPHQKAVHQLHHQKSTLVSVSKSHTSTTCCLCPKRWMTFPAIRR